MPSICKEGSPLEELSCRNSSACLENQNEQENFQQLGNNKTQLLKVSCLTQTPSKLKPTCPTATESTPQLQKDAAEISTPTSQAKRRPKRRVSFAHGPLEESSGHVVGGHPIEGKRRQIKLIPGVVPTSSSRRAAVSPGEVLEIEALLRHDEYSFSIERLKRRAGMVHSSSRKKRSYASTGSEIERALISGAHVCGGPAEADSSPSSFCHAADPSADAFGPSPTSSGSGRRQRRRLPMPSPPDPGQAVGSRHCFEAATGAACWSAQGSSARGFDEGLDQAAGGDDREDGALCLLADTARHAQRTECVDGGLGGDGPVPELQEWERNVRTWGDPGEESRMASDEDCYMQIFDDCMCCQF